MNISTPNIRPCFSKVENKPSANSTFAIGGATRFYDTFLVKESAVLRVNICAEKPAERKAANRYTQNATKVLRFKYQYKSSNQLSYLYQFCEFR